MTLDDYRVTLPEMLERADDKHAVSSHGHVGANRDELVLAYERGGRWYLAALARDRQGDMPYPYLATFYSLTESEAMDKLRSARLRE